MCIRMGGTSHFQYTVAETQLISVIQFAGDANRELNGQGVDLLPFKPDKIVFRVLVRDNPQLRCTFLTSVLLMRTPY